MTIDTQKMAIDTQKIAIDTQKMTINTQKIAIDTQKMTIDTQKIAIDTFLSRKWQVISRKMESIKEYKVVCVNRISGRDGVVSSPALCGGCSIAQFILPMSCFIPNNTPSLKQEKSVPLKIDL